jgi:hypothetical protein
MADPLRRYSPWFYGAAAYNVAWGAAVVLAPATFARALGVGGGGNLVAWQAVAVVVLSFAPGYWWAGRAPSRHAHLIAVALLGKLLGVAGFTWAAATGLLPLRFGLTILTNDVVWLVPFALYLRAVRGPASGVAGLRGSDDAPSSAAARSA